MLAGLQRMGSSRSRSRLPSIAS